MIVEISSTLWPRPIVIDTDAPSGDGMAVRILRPSVKVRTDPGGPVLASYSPEGDPSGSVLPFLLLAGVLLLGTFAAIGIVKGL